MYINNDFKLKLIFPSMLEPNNPHNRYSYSSFRWFYLPYGIGILTAFLRGYNYYVEQEDLSVRFNRHNAFLSLIFKNIDLNIDLDIRRNEKEIRRFLESGDIKGQLGSSVDKILNSTSIEGFDLIGFSVLSVLHFIFALMLAKRIKQRTNTPIVLGGAFISLYGQLYSEIFNFLDYIIVGDGRIPLLRLIDYLNKKITITEVPNLIYRDNGKLIINPRQHYPIEDIPIPDFSDLSLELYKNPCLDFPGYCIQLPYQITRGCTNRCSFCIYPNISRKLEFKSYDKVLSELSQMKEKYKSKMFHFWDDVINNSYEYLEGLCNSFIKNKLNIGWAVHAKVGNLDRHILRKMKEAGCYWLRFGIESGSDNILRRMHKGFTAEQASQTLKNASEAGLKNSICLIAGYSHETQEDIKQTIDFIRKNRKYIHDVSIYKFFLEYGSLIYLNPKKYGVENLAPVPMRFWFTFDESCGLKWEQKQEQQAYSERQIVKTVYKNAKFNGKLSIFSFYCFSLLKYIIAKIKIACFLT